LEGTLRSGAFIVRLVGLVVSITGVEVIEYAPDGSEKIGRYGEEARCRPLTPMKQATVIRGAMALIARSDAGGMDRLDDDWFIAFSVDCCCSLVAQSVLSAEQLTMEQRDLR
jgi:hypothetical protein